MADDMANMADDKMGPPVTEKKRRQYRTGSVYQRSSDGRWIATIEAGFTRTGARRRITVTGKDEAEVKAKLKKRQREIDRDGLPTTGSRITVKRWAEEWLEARRHVVRAGPWSSDAGAVHQWIVPTIGHKRLADLTPADIRAVATAQRNAGRKTSTARRTHVTLTGMLRAAILDGHQIPDRVLQVKGPQPGESDLDAMPGDQIAAVMTVAENTLPHWSRWLVQVLYGQRPAEVLGLTWDAVDFERRIISIEWQLQDLPWIDARDKTLGCVVPEGMRVRHLEGRAHLTPPKTKRGFRIVPMLPVAEAALHEWRLVAPRTPHGLVWPAADGSPPSSRDDVAEWHALQGAAEVGHPAGRYWRIYEARHAFATRLLEGGVDPHVVTELMGHSSILTSRGYQHVRTERALEALTRVNEALTERPRELG